MDPSDEVLLQQYARDGSDEAFRELVCRHVNLVYSVARRQLGSESLAADVTQSVFTDLAKAANSFKPTQPVIAWLHLVARRTAIDWQRREIRRQQREQTAAELAAMNAAPSAWAHVEPLLDEAIESLDETDRHAILLRYFENQSLRAVGEILGTSDDAAQKRVSRALEQLRAAFARRGVAITAAGLATDLSAQAVASAPAGLLATVTASVAPAAALTTGTVLTSSYPMTALTKTLLAASVVLTASLVYQATLITNGRAQLATLEQKSLAAQNLLRQRQAELDRTTALLAAQQAELDAARAQQTETVAMESALEAWLGRVAKLEDWLKKMPEKRIPEMQFLTVNDWLAVTLHNELKTENQARSALSDLRLRAKNKPEVRENFWNALKAYRQAHNNQTATSIDAIRPYLKPSLPDDILQRYEFVSEATKQAEAIRNAEENLRPTPSIMREKAPVDEDHDNLLSFTNRSHGTRNVSKFGREMTQATENFIKANQGQRPASADQLRPYFTNPVDETALQEFWKLRQSSPSPPVF